MTDQTLTPHPQDFPGRLREFAAFTRSGFDPEDAEMVAKKFEAAADEIERLRDLVAELETT